MISKLPPCTKTASRVRITWASGGNADACGAQPSFRTRTAEVAMLRFGFRFHHLPRHQTGPANHRSFFTEPTRPVEWGRQLNGAAAAGVRTALVTAGLVSSQRRRAALPTIGADRSGRWWRAAAVVVMAAVATVVVMAAVAAERAGASAGQYAVCPVWSLSQRLRFVLCVAEAPGYIAKRNRLGMVKPSSLRS